METTQECFSKDASVTDGSSEEEASATVEFVRIPIAGQENSAVNTGALCLPSIGVPVTLACCYFLNLPDPRSAGTMTGTAATSSSG